MKFEIGSKLNFFCSLLDCDGDDEYYYGRCLYNISILRISRQMNRPWQLFLPERQALLLPTNNCIYEDSVIRSQFYLLFKELISYNK